MGYMTNGLAFNTLRGANRARLPQFKNKHGQTAHSKPDGSDWSPAQWLQALIGEVGEWAQVRLDYENGKIGRQDYEVVCAKELADIQTYLDLLALRSLDVLNTFRDVTGAECQGHPFEHSPAQKLMCVVAALGKYANERKKFDRRDLSFEEYHALADEHLLETDGAFISLTTIALRKLPEIFGQSHEGDAVRDADPHGVNLGQATMDKFNEVSERVGSTVRVSAEDWHHDWTYTK